jgi:hypothetical protein
MTISQLDLRNALNFHPLAIVRARSRPPPLHWTTFAAVQRHPLPSAARRNSRKASPLDVLQQAASPTAMVPNRDIGFVEAGQQAAIKIDTFSFTRYGLLNGKVLNVSRDSTARDKPQDKSTDSSQASEQASSEPKGQELVYAARVSLDRTQMQIENKLVNLSPGMAVTVEIKTGSRRIISYLLSPLLRYTQESLRER